jgi:hypothetical protein
VHIALDTNIFWQDRWFEKQNMRALIDYLSRTPWKLVLSEVVEEEVKAHVRRDFEAKAGKVRQALNDAGRSGLMLLPDFNAWSTVDASVAEWEQRWNTVLDRLPTERVSVSENVAREAVRRAANRVPPCKESGEGIRDALIWLSLLEAVGVGRNYDRLAFVSTNTGDFAASGQKSLRRELSDDLKSWGSDIHYYVSLDDFLKERAEPVRHITREWIREHLDMSYVKQVVRGYVLSGGADHLFKPTDSRQREQYTPLGDASVTELDLKLHEFYVWQFEDGHVELRMTFLAMVKANVYCAHWNAITPWVSPETGEVYPGGWWLEETEPAGLVLPCSAELGFDISARVQGSRIEDIGLENAYAAHHIGFRDTPVAYQESKD